MLIDFLPPIPFIFTFSFKYFSNPLLPVSPFGNTNRDLKKRLEFTEEGYKEIDKYCKEKGIIWFASVWDIESVDFLEKFNVPCYKIASACLTNTCAKRLPVPSRDDASNIDVTKVTRNDFSQNAIALLTSVANTCLRNFSI